MANAYTQLIIQIVIVVQFREAMVTSDMKDEMEMYISGIIQSHGHKLLAIYCMPDHTHILVGLNPNQSVSELVRLIKANSSKHINERGLCQRKFQWQKGYGAFSYSLSALPRVASYIENQKEHHARKKFAEEYKSFLKEYEIAYDERYTFKDPE